MSEAHPLTLYVCLLHSTPCVSTRLYATNQMASDAEASAAYQVLEPTTTDIVYFRPAAIEDLDSANQLETVSYPPDEAATKEKLEYRLKNANNLFLIAATPSGSDGHNAVGERIIGYTCGTCAHGDKLTHASMSQHEPDGPLLCIHSVVVAPDLRRRGIATRMLRAYLAYVQASTPHLKSVRLLCKEQLIPLYERAGFKLVGPSDVVHGQDLWYELVHKFELADGQ